LECEILLVSLSGFYSGFRKEAKIKCPAVKFKKLAAGLCFLVFLNPTALILARGYKYPYSVQRFAGYGSLRKYPCTHLF
jgi:hypothetical protein